MRTSITRTHQSANFALENLITIAETLLHESFDMQNEMYDICKDARRAGAAMEHICQFKQKDDLTRLERNAVMQASFILLRTITKVVVTIDHAAIARIIGTKEKPPQAHLEFVNKYIQFSNYFYQFGCDMIKLMHLLCDEKNEVKYKRRRAHAGAAKQILERSTSMLVTACKVCLEHPESALARENRDSVFFHIRRVTDLLHFLIKDSAQDKPDGNNLIVDMEHNLLSAHACMKHLIHLLKFNMVTLDNTYHPNLQLALSDVLERAEDFTDSAYTSNSQREAILESSDRLKLELEHLIGMYATCRNFDELIHRPEIENGLSVCISLARNLSRNIHNAGIQQAQQFSDEARNSSDLLNSIRQSARTHSNESLKRTAGAFLDSVDRVLEVCKSLRHIAPLEWLQVTANFTEINLRVYGPQVIVAAKILTAYPDCQIAMENLEMFSDTYEYLLGVITAMVKEVLHPLHTKPSTGNYMSLPRPGKHGTTVRAIKPAKTRFQEEPTIIDPEPEEPPPPPPSNEPFEEGETEEPPNTNKQEKQNNDMVKMSKNMSEMACSMYQFTKGEGDLRTTQDLFTQAEYFAEEANRLYKIIREFSYQVPCGSYKKELLDYLDRVPTFVQRLQFTVKNHTVGKSATFTKVDNVINETRELMNVIAQVVSSCFECATKYNLDIRGNEGDKQRGYGAMGVESSGTGGNADSKGGSGPGQDQSL